MSKFGYFITAEFINNNQLGCKGINPSVFFPEDAAGVRKAQSICRKCPVRFICLEYALEAKETYGIWGGISERGRKRLVVSRREPQYA